MAPISPELLRGDATGVRSVLGALRAGSVAGLTCTDGRSIIAERSPNLLNLLYSRTGHLPSHQSYTALDRVCCRIRLYGIKRAVQGGAVVAGPWTSPVCLAVRSRLLRAACRPCSRGPDRGLYGGSAPAMAPGRGHGRVGFQSNPRIALLAASGGPYASVCADFPRVPVNRHCSPQRLLPPSTPVQGEISHLRRVTT